MERDSAARSDYAAPMSDSSWQPIDTAPKDGTDILAYLGKGRVGVVCWWDSPPGWYSMKSAEQPTHWKPLPAPPEVQE